MRPPGFAHPTAPFAPSRWAARGGIGALVSIAVAMGRGAVAPHAPTALWIVLIAAITVVTILAIVFDFLLRNKAANLDKEKAAAEADRARIREMSYWGAIDKGAAEPANSAHYAELSDAAARYVGVEKNGIKPADKTHGQLYGHHPPAADQDSLQPPAARGDEGSVGD
jgi:hypothetical protein